MWFARLPSPTTLIANWEPSAMSNDIYRYYVYAYLRSNGTPYYIGKGCNKRAYVKHETIPVPKDKSRIVFLETNLSNTGALALERRYIEWYGRKDLGTGILRNMTDGGDGGDNISPEARAKLSAINKGKKRLPETKAKISAKLKGRKISPEIVSKVSAANKGKKRSPESRARMSAAQKGEKNHRYGKPAHNRKSSSKESSLDLPFTKRVFWSLN